MPNIIYYENNGYENQIPHITTDIGKCAQTARPTIRYKIINFLKETKLYNLHQIDYLAIHIIYFK